LYSRAERSHQLVSVSFHIALRCLERLSGELIGDFEEWLFQKKVVVVIEGYFGHGDTVLCRY